MNPETKNNGNTKSEKSIPEQIREYKELLDDGIIDKEEFEEKEKRITWK